MPCRRWSTRRRAGSTRRSTRRSAATGRLSSSDPNLQNIPARTRAGAADPPGVHPARRAGCSLTADYSQIELRLLAHFCGDETLRQAFAEDRDVHAAVAAQIFKVTEAEVTTAQRRDGQDGELRRHLRHERRRACRRGWRSRGRRRRSSSTQYFARYPKVLAYQDELAGEVPHRPAYVGTILGRRRHVRPDGDPPELAATSSRNQAEREAINMEIQGSAADLMKLAMLAVHRRLTAREAAGARCC